jgi:hypothetical protein
VALGDSTPDRQLHRSLLAALALAAIGSAWILTRATPLALDGDAQMLLHPLLVDVARQLRHGELPVWTMGRWGGSPLIGDPVVGALYPAYWVSYLLTPFPHWRGLDVSTCLHLFILSSGVAVLMHRLGAGPVAVVATAAMIALNPTVVYAVRGWQQYWAALSWWPWLFWAGVTLAAAPRVVPAMVASVAIAAQVYAGYPEFSLYSGLPALGWILVAPGGMRRVGLVLVIGIGAILLAMPQLFTGLDMARHSLRLEELSGENMTVLDQFFSVSLAHWSNVMRTDPGIGLASPAKMAPAVVLLAAVGATGRGFARYLAVLAVLFAILATRDNPLYPILRVVPPFSFFGAPLKLFYPLSFVLIVLAGLGLTRLAGLAPLRRRVVVGLVGVATALSWGAAPLMTSGLVVVFALAALLPMTWLPCAAAGLAFAGSIGFLAATRALHVQPLFVPPGFIELVHQPPPVRPRDGGRMLALLPWAEFSQAGLNYGSLWDIDSWNGMADLTQRRQVKVIEAQTPANAVALARQIGGDPIVVGANSRHATEFAAAGYSTVGQLGTLRFLAAPEAPAPRVVLVPRAKAVTADVAIAAARLGRALDARHVLIEADTLPGGANGDPSGRLTDVVHARGMVEARVAVTRPTWLIVREPYYRNWRATIDGHAAEVHPAGAFMMGVLVGAGTHDVRLAYHERGLPVGLAIAALGAILLPFGVRRVI